MEQSFKVLAIITARAGSKRIPQKNTKLLGGVPLVVHTFTIAKKSTLITDLIVSTDDHALMELAREHNVSVPFVRPADLATDTTPHIQVVKHALLFMEKEKGVKYDAVLILQPTSPFRTVADIDETIQKLISHPEATSAVSICKISDNHPVKIKRLDGNVVLPYSVLEPKNNRSQDLPVAYKRSGAAYVIRRETLIDRDELYGPVVVGHIVPEERSIDIDDEFHWLKAEYMLNKLKYSKGD